MPDVSLSDENYKPFKQEIILNYAQLDCKHCISDGPQAVLTRIFKIRVVSPCTPKCTSVYACKDSVALPVSICTTLK